jgi:hypothetical protein
MKKKAVPAALAERATALAAAKKKRLLMEARSLVALVHRKRAMINEAYYELGQAIARLKEPEMLLALGCKTFSELCARHLGLSQEVASRLVEIVQSMTREEAIGVGQSRAMALVDLAKATPDADTPGELYRRGRVDLPGGATVDTKKASARQLFGAAKKIRIASKRLGGRRGRTTTSDERAIAEAVQSALHAAGLREARVTAVASKPGAESYLRIERVLVSKRRAAGRALAKT